MASHRSSRGSVCTLLALVLSLAAAGCVDPFGGSHIQFTLAGSVQVPGTPSDFGRPPPGTHFEFHAVEHVTEEQDGTEVIVRTFTYEIANFEIVPVINQASPCFIEDDEARFPGLHVTQVLRKLQQVTGVDDPYNPPAEATEGDVIDVLTAEVRMGNLGRLQTNVKAVTSHDPTPYPTDIPPADQIDDASNAERRAKCEAFWAEHPLKYEGSDKVFTLPLNGTWFGAVDGADPRNDQFLGGAGFFVEADLGEIDGMLLNWQYNCAPGEYLDLSECERQDPRAAACAIACEPDYPDALPDEEKSDVGVHYMSGSAVSKTRGVINVPMTNRTFGQISGEAAIWFDLDDDDVQF